MPGLAADYRPLPTREYDVEEGGGRRLEDREVVARQGIILKLVSHILTLLSYTVFIVLLPVTYWICVLKLKQTDRIVIFRLGKLIGSRGPGRVLVFPWIDRVQKVDVSNSAFSVPPQQLITNDGGIVEIGAEVQFAITDCVALVREVADHQDILRSLGKTVMVRLLVKRNVPQLLKEKNICSQEIVKELNHQVRKWGLDIRCVSLSEVKVLKQPQASQPSAAGLSPLHPGEKVQYPSPIEFARQVYSTTSASSVSCGGERRPGSPDLLALIEQAEKDGVGWTACLEVLIDENLEPEIWGTYAIEITDEGTVYFLQIGEENRHVHKIATGEDEGWKNADLKIKISGSDFAGILKGSLPPLQAYLAGRINTAGDVRKLMFFDKISNRSHRPGQTFSI